MIKTEEMLTEEDMPVVYNRKALREPPDLAKGCLRQASEDRQADGTTGHGKCGDLIELEPGPMEHLQGKEGTCMRAVRNSQGPSADATCLPDVSGTCAHHRHQ